MTPTGYIKVTSDPKEPLLAESLWNKDIWPYLVLRVIGLVKSPISVYLILSQPPPCL